MKRTKILKRLTFAFFSIIAIVIVTSSNTTNVFATDAVTKSKMNAVYECYKKGQMTGILTSNEWKGMNGIEGLDKLCGCPSRLIHWRSYLDELS